jgi:hypothetical protein
MELGTEIGKMRRNLFTGSRKTARGCSTQATKWQRNGNQIDAAVIFARVDLVNVLAKTGLSRPASGSLYHAEQSVERPGFANL